MIRLGPIEIELISAKAGDEGWSEHWQVTLKRGKTRKLLGYAVNPQGAAQIAVAAVAAENERATAAVREWARMVLEVRQRMGLTEAPVPLEKAPETTS